MFHPGLIARRPRLHLQTLAALIVACCVALISAHAASAAKNAKAALIIRIPVPST